MLSLSVAAPAFNEADAIEDVVLAWVGYLRDARLVRFEIVICDDGSTDKTGAILERLAAELPELKVVTLPVNRGAAAALTAAIARTTMDWVLLIDTDGQFPIENLGRLQRAVTRDGGRAAVGVRRHKKDFAFARFGSWSSGAVCNALHRTSYRDFNCALKLVLGPLIRSIPLEAKGLNYSTEVTSKLIERGERLVEVEVDHRPRQGGLSSLRVVKGSLHRLLFVGYVAYRQLLLRLGVLQSESSR